MKFIVNWIKTSAQIDLVDKQRVPLAAFKEITPESGSKNPNN